MPVNNRIINFVIILLIITILTVLFISKVSPHMVDYAVFHKAGERFISGEMLYQSTDGHYQFKYMPFSAVYFIIPSLFPLLWGKLIWFIIVLLSVFGTFYYSYRFLKTDNQSWLYVLLPTILITARFFVREIDLGQSNAVMIALIILMINALIQKKENHAGIFLGIASTLKPYAIIFIPYLLLKKKWRAAGISMMFLVISFFAPVMRYGWDGNLSLLNEWKISLSGSTPQLLTNPDNISFFGMYAKWFGIENLSLVSILAFGTIMIIGIFVLVAIIKPISFNRNDNNQITAKTKSALISECAILLILIPLLTPQGWDNIFFSSTLGIIYLLSIRNSLQSIIRWVLYIDLIIIAFTIYDILGRSLYSVFMHSSALTICFVIIIGILLWSRFQMSIRSTH